MTSVSTFMQCFVIAAFICLCAFSSLTNAMEDKINVEKKTDNGGTSTFADTAMTVLGTINDGVNLLPFHMLVKKGDRLVDTVNYSFGVGFGFGIAFSIAGKLVRRLGFVGRGLFGLVKTITGLVCFDFMGLNWIAVFVMAALHQTSAGVQWGTRTFGELVPVAKVAEHAAEEVQSQGRSLAGKFQVLIGSYEFLMSFYQSLQLFDHAFFNEDEKRELGTILGSTLKLSILYASAPAGSDNPQSVVMND